MSHIEPKNSIGTESQLGLPGGKQHNLPSPPAVDAALVLFFLMTMFTLFACLTISIVNTTDGNYSYIIPVALYLLLYVVFITYNRSYSIRTRQKASIGDIIWGFDEAYRVQVAFLLASLALIFWMNSLSGSMAYVYIPLFGQTLGMLSGQLGNKILAGALVILEVGTLVFQVGLVDDAFNQRMSFGELAGFGVSIVSFVVIVGIIMALIRSRMESERLIVELRQTQARLEEALQKENEVAVLRERERMAREMHDVLGHALVLVAVKIEAAQRLQAVNPAKGNEELEATKDLVRQSMADLRTSLADLRSPAFEADAQPLSKALGAWADRTGRESNLAIQCDFEPETDKLPPPVQDALWRVGREAIVNVVKHARAHNVKLASFFKGGEVYLTIVDDGVGIPRLGEGNARLEVEGHYGIRGMRERVEALGGHLTLKPGRDEHGTMVIATVPLSPSENGQQSSGTLSDSGAGNGLLASFGIGRRSQAAGGIERNGIVKRH